MKQRQVKPRYNYPILKKGGKHLKSRKRERREAKKEIRYDCDNEIRLRNVNRQNRKFKSIRSVK